MVAGITDSHIGTDENARLRLDVLFPLLVCCCTTSFGACTWIGNEVSQSGDALPSPAFGPAVRHPPMYPNSQEGLCNSIGCPGGYIPIPDAWMVECDSDPCDVSQCCQAFCAFHPCPSGYTPVTDAQTLECPTEGCSDDLCCEAFCSYHPCPNGYIPIPDAGTTLCTGNTCSDEQCCVAGETRVTRVLVDNLDLRGIGTLSSWSARSLVVGHGSLRASAELARPGSFVCHGSAA